MKITLLLVVSSLLVGLNLNAAPANPRIQFAYTWIWEVFPNYFETNFVGLAEQLPNHQMSVRKLTTVNQQPELGFEVLGVACYSERQWFYFSTRWDGQTELYFRSIQYPCPGNLLPSPQFAQEPNVVIPYVLTQKKNTLGQTVRTCGYVLLEGRSYELQVSDDSGVTWYHKDVTCNFGQEPLIQPGVEGIGLCGESWWFIDDIISYNGRRLARFVDWTDVPNKPLLF